MRENPAASGADWQEIVIQKARGRGLGAPELSGQKLAMAVGSLQREQPMNRKQTAKERNKQIKLLMDSATPEEKRRIEKARRQGRRLRKELEDLGKG